MKLYPAGFVSEVDAFNMAYNCSRNPQCQPEYFAWMPDFENHPFFFDLDAAEKAEQAATNNPDFRIDLTTALDSMVWRNSAGLTGACVINNAVLGRDWDGRAYGVLNNVQLIDGDSNCVQLVLKIVGLTTGDFYFFSEMMVFNEPCPNGIRMEACYPNPNDNEEARDANDVYYGYTSVPADSFGDLSLRYQHFLYLRTYEIYGTKAGFAIKYHNSLRAFRTTSSFEKVFSTQLLPEFMMRDLLAIMARGNITTLDPVSGVITAYRVAEKIDWSIVDEGNKMFKCDTVLIEEKSVAINCAGDCGLPVVPPCLQVDYTIEFVNDGGDLTITLTFATPITRGNIVHLTINEITALGLTELASDDQACDEVGGCSVFVFEFPSLDLNTDDNCYQASVELECIGITNGMADVLSKTFGSNCENLVVQNQTSADVISGVTCAHPPMPAVNGGSTLIGHHLDMVDEDVSFDLVKEDQFTPVCATLLVDGVVMSQITAYDDDTYTFPDAITAAPGQEVKILLQTGACHSPNFILINTTGGVSATNVIGVPDFIFDVAHPVDSGDPAFTHDHGTGNMILRITISGTPTPNPAGLTLTINGIFMECLNITGTGDYIFAAVDVVSTDEILVTCGFSACP